MPGRKLVALHPLLIAVAPVLYLYANNVAILEYRDVVPSLLFCLVSVLVVFAVLSLALRNLYKGAILTSLASVLFFAHGHIYDTLETFHLESAWGFPFIRHRFLFLVWTCILGFVAFRVAKAEGNSNLLRTNLFMFTVAGALVAMSTGQLLVHKLNSPDSDFMATSPGEQAVPSEGPGYQFRELPDIYYIILDSYSRNDDLLAYHGYDNSEFTDFLRSRGFYVASESRSNYSSTFQSLSTSLNMQYLPSLRVDVCRRVPDYERMGNLIDHSLVASTLQNLGYRFVFISSGWDPSRHGETADGEYIYPTRFRVSILGKYPVTLTDFELLFGRTTALEPLLSFDVIRREKRGGIAYGFEQLSAVPSREEPTFTLVHLLMPHEPSVFQPDDAPAPEGATVDGVVVDVGAYDKDSGYVDEVMYANRRVARLVEDLLAQSDVPPIIIIQADHGRGVQDLVPKEQADDPTVRRVRFAILNAYYLPNGGSDQLYPSITPVNSFRVILDYYFGTDLGQLQDKICDPRLCGVSSPCKI